MRAAMALLVGAILLWQATAVPRAERLSGQIRPIHYDLAFDVDLSGERFEGVETIRIQLDQPSTRVTLNALGLTFHDATIRSSAAARPQTASVALNSDAQTATLTVPQTIPAGTAEIHLTYSGVLTRELRGFYLSTSTGRNYAITQFESSDARRAFPCFDDPALKATFALQLTIDRGDTAISNGAIVSDTPGPGSRQHTLTFSTSPRMSSYLVAIAVGDFQCLSDTVENIPIRVCATPNKRELGHIALDWARLLLVFYNQYYSIKYPFGKLDMIAVPDFAAGGMENTAAIFYREEDLLADSATASPFVRKNIASILAHEMSHQWFGDLVTMRWWDDLWLNEGFATWMANRPLDEARPEWSVAVDEVDETRIALNLDALKNTRAIRSSVDTPDEIEASFDAIAYQKGGAVLRMIERYVGPELFRSGINRYLEKYAYGSATSEDFWTVMAAASGKPVDRILPTFVNQPGAPVIDVSLSCANGRTELSLRQSRFLLDTAGLAARAGGPPNALPAQTPPAPASGTSDQQWQIPICIKTPGQPAGASATPCDVLSRATETIAVGAGCRPWVFINADAHGYFRTAYSPAMLRALAPVVASQLTAPERASLADDEWAMVSAGRHSVADYLTLAGGFGNERTAALLGQITNRLEFIHDNVVTEATRPPFAAWVRSLLKPLFNDLGMGVPGDATPGNRLDTEDRRALRSVVIGALGLLGDDPDVVATAREAVTRALTSRAPADRLDPVTAAAIIRVAARQGNRALFDALMAAADRATIPDEHYRYLYAVTAFEDPALSQLALEYSLSPSIRTQDIALYLARFVGNPAVNARAWRFIKEHWTELQPKMNVAFGEARVVEALGTFCNAEARDDVKAFLAAHEIGTASRTVDQTIERMNNCIALRAKQAPLLAEWLAAR